MRRGLLFAAFLLLLGLTTATAASFSVQAEDITSFSTPVSISVPTTTPPDPSAPPVSTDPWYLFREPPAPGGLSTDPELGGPHKAEIEPSPGESLFTQASVAKYYVWSSGTLLSGLNFKNQPVTLNVFLTAGGTQVEAALLDCPSGAALASSSCAVLGSGTTTSSQGNRTVVELGEISALVTTGRELRLKIVNRDDKTWMVEWGYGSARDSNLAIGSPSP